METLKSDSFEKNDCRKIDLHQDLTIEHVWKPLKLIGHE